MPQAREAQSPREDRACHEVRLVASAAFCSEEPAIDRHYLPAAHALHVLATRRKGHTETGRGSPVK